MGIFNFLKKNKNIENNNGLNVIYYDNGRGPVYKLFEKENGNIHGICLWFHKNGHLSMKQVHRLGSCITSRSFVNKLTDNSKELETLEEKIAIFEDEKRQLMKLDKEDNPSSPEYISKDSKESYEDRLKKDIAEGRSVVLKNVPGQEKPKIYINKAPTSYNIDGTPNWGKKQDPKENSWDAKKQEQEEKSRKELIGKIQIDEKKEEQIPSTKEFDKIITSMIDFNKDSHTFSDGNTVHKGDGAFSNFMECVELHARTVKLFSHITKHKKSGNKINGEVYPDWEALKKYYVSLRKLNLDGVDLMMRAEATIACQYDFGRLDVDTLVNLSRYYKEEIDEQEVDKIFGEFLLKEQ